MVINWLSFILLSFAVFRLARLFVFDTIMAPLRSLFHEEKTETAPDGTTETYIVIKEKASGHLSVNFSAAIGVRAYGAPPF